MAKAAYWTITDADARKCGYQTGLDTLVVHTVNDEYSLFAIYCKRPSESDKYSTWGVLNAFAAAPKSCASRHLVFIVYGVDYQGI